MAASWWDLGEGSGRAGITLEIYAIACPFCEQQGNFTLDHQRQSRHARSSKILNFETYQCNNCAKYMMVLWSRSTMGKMHNYKLLPWPMRLEEWPEEWPDAVGRYWVQAQRTFNDENWDAAAMTARSALQLALRDQGAKRGSLKQEIDDLADKGLLPPLMKDWSHEVRELGNESAHPDPAGRPTSSDDARDIVRFLDYTLEYLYTMPHQIEQYWKRRTPKTEVAEPEVEA